MDNVTVMNEPPRLGILPVTTELMEHLFCLPEGYHIVAVYYRPEFCTLDFLLMSDALPPVKEYGELPRLSLHVTVDYHPDAPVEYRKITTEVKRI